MYYQQTPISEKPEKDDTYFVKFKGVPELSEVIYEANKWHSNWMQIVEFWLKPITGVVMTEEEIERAKRLFATEQLNQLLNTFTYPEYWRDLVREKIALNHEYIKRFKQ